MDNAWSPAPDTAVPAGTVPWNNLLLALVIGLGAALITLAVAYRWNRVGSLGVKTRAGWIGAGWKYDVKAGKGLPAAATWKFSDSWASNLTAVTAAGAAVFTGLSGKVSGAFSPDSLASFVVSTAVFLVVAALAPLAYAACQTVKPKQQPAVGVGGSGPGGAAQQTGGAADRIAKAAVGNPVPTSVATASADDETTPALRGTKFGLYLATTLTSWAVMGALASVGVLVVGADAWPRSAKIAVSVALGLVAALIATYVVRSVRWLLEDANTPSKKPKPAEAPDSLAGLVHDDRGRRMLSVL